MGIFITVTVTGLQELIDTFGGELEPLIESQAALAIERIAMATRDSAMAFASAGHPGNPNVQTGRLRGSISYIMDGLSAAVGSALDYASWVEFGHAQTPGRYVEALGKRLVASFVPPYPFMRPAMTDVVDSGLAQSIATQTMEEIFV